MKQYAVIGLGRFGASVARNLAASGEKVIAVDNNEELVHGIMDNVFKAVCLDAVDEKAVRSVGIHNADVAICGVGTDIESSILITLMLKDLGVPIVICKATNLEHKKVLEKVGATRVILPEKDIGARLAENLVAVSATILDRIGLSYGASIIEFAPPREFVGKSLRDLNMRAEYGVNVIAVKKRTGSDDEGEILSKKDINVTPRAEDIVGKDDVLVIFGEDESIEAMRTKFHTEGTGGEK